MTTRCAFPPFGIAPFGLGDIFDFGFLPSLPTIPPFSLPFSAQGFDFNFEVPPVTIPSFDLLSLLLGFLPELPPIPPLPGGIELPGMPTIPPLTIPAFSLLDLFALFLALLPPIPPLSLPECLLDLA